MARQEGVQSALQMRVSSFLSGKPIQQVVEQAEADLRAAQERLDHRAARLGDRVGEAEVRAGCRLPGMKSVG